MRDLISQAMAAEALGVCQSAVVYMSRTGKLKRYRRGGRPVYLFGDVFALREARLAKPTNAGRRSGRTLLARRALGV
jgi:hypothetical protein